MCSLIIVVPLGVLFSEITLLFVKPSFFQVAYFCIVGASFVFLSVNITYFN